MSEVAKDLWEYISDTPEEFEDAINNAVSENERVFFENLLYKVMNEPAFSNDVLMHDKDNEDGIFILRVSDDFLIGRVSSNSDISYEREEYSGLFPFLKLDMFKYLGHHITVQEWLRKRDYSGIRYDGNNDER